MQCSKSTDTVTPAPGPTPVQNDLVLSVNSLTMYAANGYTASFTITTDQNWTITNNTNWLNVSPTSGGPGSAIKINLTTTTLNTVTGITGSLSVNATGKPELNKTLNLTRSNYAFCGVSLGLSGSSIVVSKWVSMGAADHSELKSILNPNGRILVAVAKGCGGPNNTNENLIKQSTFVRLGFITGANVTIFSNTVYFTNSPFIGLSATTFGFNVISYYRYLFNNWETDTNQKFDRDLFNDDPFLGGLQEFSKCNTNNKYLKINLSLEGVQIQTPGAQTCITDAEFPPELKDTMNALLEGAGKTYRIP